ncbi:hypothetical protein PENSPDRAFT_203112 [Peniophora sp. CONT]|nr:hypothetical protein PENSPDRAFT_203112 [Peniophora sp. CONT]
MVEIKIELTPNRECATVLPHRPRWDQFYFSSSVPGRCLSSQVGRGLGQSREHVSSTTLIDTRIASSFVEAWLGSGSQQAAWTAIFHSMRYLLQLSMLAIARLQRPAPREPELRTSYYPTSPDMGRIVCPMHPAQSVHHAGAYLPYTYGPTEARCDYWASGKPSPN